MAKAFSVLSWNVEHFGASAPNKPPKKPVGPIIDLVALPRTGANMDHLCLVVEPEDIEAVAADDRFTVVDGPDRRYGARGDGWSIYVLDPDGNTVELRSYGAIPG